MNFTLLRFSFLALGLNWAMGAYALVLDSEVKSPALNMFIHEVEKALPKSFKADIDQRLKISFVEFNGEKSIDPQRVCSLEKGSAHSYGAAHHFFDQIELHAGFLPIIEAAYRGDVAIALGCSHKDLYTLAKGALIHEIAHFYDRHTHKRLSGRTIGKPGPRAHRRGKRAYESAQKNHFSSIPTYGYIAGWKLNSASSSKLKMKHRKVVQSPDFYEYQSIEENFAVNTQFFLLDPDYQCRRPSQYEFMAKEFEHRPFPERNCGDDITVPILKNNRLVLERINPHHIRDVHYLFAGEADSLMSRWGHSMFRFSVCPPELSDRRCRIDSRKNFSLNFTGFIPGLDIQALDGLVGNYDSVVTISPLSTILNQYNVGEMRDVFSYPIQMSQKEKLRFIKLAAQRAWGYMGSYKFLSNNCADESLDFLKAVMWSPKIQNSYVTTPLGLRDELESLGLIKTFSMERAQEERRKSRYFPSKMLSIKKALRLLGMEEKDANAYFDSPVAQRKKFAKTLKSSAAIWNLVIVEGHMLSSLQEQLKNKTLKFLKEQSSLDPQIDKQLKLLSADHITSIKRSRLSYGIPLAGEKLIATGEKVDVATVVKGLEHFSKDVFKNEKEEIEELKNFIKELGQLSQTLN